MFLNNLKKIKEKSAKKFGFGYGSGKGGHTTGRGQKGQKARYNINPMFEGGQLPLQRRLPKLHGFKRAFVDRMLSLNLSSLSKIEAEVITPEVLKDAGLIGSIPQRGIKVLGMGEVKSPLKFKGVKFSKVALKKVTDAGGSIS